MTSLKIVSDHQHLKKKPSLFWNKVNFDDIVAIFFININKSVGPLHKLIKKMATMSSKLTLFQNNEGFFFKPIQDKK